MFNVTFRISKQKDNHLQGNIVISSLQPSSRTAIFSTEALNLKKIDPDRFIVRCEVDENCQLKQFLKNLGLAYAKGCAFYELISNEIISEDKEMIFMKVMIICYITYLCVHKTYFAYRRKLRNTFIQMWNRVYCVKCTVCMVKWLLHNP